MTLTAESNDRWILKIVALWLIPLISENACVREHAHGHCQAQCVFVYALNSSVYVSVCVTQWRGG